MGRENRNEAVAALHRARMMDAAERMFAEKGFAQTTIADISAASTYSRRTIYAYFEGKEDILHHILAKGLRALKADIEAALQLGGGFLVQYAAICEAIKRYQTDCPHSFETLAQANTAVLDLASLSPAVAEMLALGSEINALLAAWIVRGKEAGVVRQSVLPLPSVYLLWAEITSLVTLVATKGAFIAKSCATTEEDYLAYGFQQIINSILEVPIAWKTKQA